MTRTTESAPNATYEQLIEAARQASKHSYSPISRYPVGAAVLTADGTVYTGCNIENANLTTSVCAERSAAIKAICDGHRQFQAVAVVTPIAGSWPCGNCRQFLAEFGRQVTIVIAAGEGKIKTETLQSLLPEAPVASR